jgi:hypothetical protein
MPALPFESQGSGMRNWRIGAKDINLRIEADARLPIVRPEFAHSLSIICKGHMPRVRSLSHKESCTLSYHMLAEPETVVLIQEYVSLFHPLEFCRASHQGVACCLAPLPKSPRDSDTDAMASATDSLVPHNCKQPGSGHFSRFYYAPEERDIFRILIDLF